MKKLTILPLLSLIFGVIGGLFALIGTLFLALAPRCALNVQLALVDGDPEALFVCGVVFAVIGVSFLLVTAVLFFLHRRQTKVREELLAWGNRVTGTVEDIPVDGTVRVNGRSPLRLLVRVTHPATGESLVLRSHQVWETSLSNGDPVDVLFDPMDEKKYVIDAR